MKYSSVSVPSFRFVFLIVFGLTFISGYSSAFAEEQIKLDKNRFENDIKEFEKKDRASMPPAGGTVFVGSSTFTLWKSLERDFAEFKPINRAFGGSTLPEQIHYVDRVVCKYKPKKIVMYAGTNDVAELKHSGKQIAKDVETYLGLISKCAPEADVYFVSMSMAPSRIEYESVYDEGNKLVREFMSKNKHWHYIDVIPLMRNKRGELKKELFGADSLHMNAKGYVIWRPVILSALSAKKS